MSSTKNINYRYIHSYVSVEKPKNPISFNFMLLNFTLPQTIYCIPKYNFEHNRLDFRAVLKSININI